MKSEPILLKHPVEISILRDGQLLMKQLFQHSPIRIGRILENDIVLPFDGISRHHCQIYLDKTVWRVKDLGSLNGIRVEGVRSNEADLSVRKEFELKPVTIQFRVLDEKVVSFEATVEKTQSVHISGTDETLMASSPAKVVDRAGKVGTDKATQPRKASVGKRLHSSETTDVGTEIAPRGVARPFVAAGHRRLALVNIDAQDLLGGAHPTIEKAKAKAVQVTVLWHDVVLSVEEFVPGEPMTFDWGGHSVRLGRVGRDRAELRSPKGFQISARDGDGAMTLQPSASVAWTSEHGLKVMARFVPQSRRIATPFTLIEAELVNPAVLSGVVHGSIAIATMVMSKSVAPPPLKAPEPERIATIVAATPTPPAVAPTPRPTPLVRATPRPTPPPVVRATPVPRIEKKLVKTSKPPPLPAAKPSVAEKKPEKVAVAPKVEPTPEPTPFQASSVGALKMLTLVSGGQPPSASAEKIVVRRYAGDSTRNPGASTTEMMNQIPVSENAATDGAADGAALNVSKGGSSYGTGGFSGKAGKRSVLGSVVGGASYTELAKTEGLTREQVMKVVQKHQTGIQQCYERSLMDDPALAGRAEFEWEISAAGAVGDVRVKETNLKNGEKLLDCVKGVFKKMRFPQAKNGAATTPTIGLPFGRL